LPVSTVVPTPPDPSTLDPLIQEWDAGVPIVRCHDARFGATEFNRTASEGRFRAVRRRGRIVGTIYGSDDNVGAIAEHVFRPAPVGGAVRRVRRSRLVPVLMSTLTCTRTLRLASLHGLGLRRVGATRAQLIDAEADQYPLLTPWGQAFHDCSASVDGIVWRSRHYDDSYAFLLYLAIAYAAMRSRCLSLRCHSL
jgi:hypothetical protein